MNFKEQQRMTDLEIANTRLNTKFCKLLEKWKDQEKTIASLKEELEHERVVSNARSAQLLEELEVMREALGTRYTVAKMARTWNEFTDSEKVQAWGENEKIIPLKIVDTMANSFGLVVAAETLGMQKSELEAALKYLDRPAGGYYQEAALKALLGETELLPLEVQESIEEDIPW